MARQNKRKADIIHANVTPQPQHESDDPDARVDGDNAAWLGAALEAAGGARADEGPLDGEPGSTELVLQPPQPQAMQVDLAPLHLVESLPGDPPAELVFHLQLCSGTFLLHNGASEVALRTLLQATVCGPFNDLAEQQLSAHYRDLRPTDTAAWVPSSDDFVAALYAAGCTPSSFPSTALTCSQRSTDEQAAAAAQASSSVRPLLRLLVGLCRPARHAGLVFKQASFEALLVLLLRLQLDTAVTRVAGVEVADALAAVIDKCDDSTWAAVAPSVAFQASRLGPASDAAHRAQYRAIRSIPAVTPRSLALRQQATMHLLRRLMAAAGGASRGVASSAVALPSTAVLLVLAPMVHGGDATTGVQGLLSAAGFRSPLTPAPQGGAAAPPIDFWRLRTMMQALNLAVWCCTYSRGLPEDSDALREWFLGVVRDVTRKLEARDVPKASASEILVLLGEMRMDSDDVY